MSPPSRPGLAAHTRAGAGRSSGSWAGGAVDAAPGSYRPSLPKTVWLSAGPRSGWHLGDGCRSHIPLRGSSGVAPDSLFGDQRPARIVPVVAGPGGQGGLEVGQVAAVTDLPQEPGVALGVRLPGRLGLVLHGAADHVVGHR